MFKTFRKFFQRVFPPACSLGKTNHEWIIVGEGRHFWNEYTDGSTSGQYSEFATVLAYPARSWPYQKTREQFTQWLKEGYNAYHTSFVHWQCSKCGANGAHTEKYYPFKISKEQKEAGSQAIKVVTKLVT